MDRQGGIPRSRGGICGVLLILLGLWGGLAPFIGPYFHFGYTPDTTWVYNSGRLYFSVVPGAAALLGGLLVAATRHRGVGVFGGLLGALGGAWFIAGDGFVTYVLKKTIAIGTPILSASSAGGQPLRLYLETVGLFTGVGLLLLFVGALAIGRFSMVSARDVAAADGYYAEFPAAEAASQPEVSQYPAPRGQYQTPSGQYQTPSGQYPAPGGQYPTAAGQFPAGGQFAPSGQFPETPSHFPDAPTQFPDTTTAQPQFPDTTTSG